VHSQRSAQPVVELLPGSRLEALTEVLLAERDNVQPTGRAEAQLVLLPICHSQTRPAALKYLSAKMMAEAQQAGW
jgi:hypothetical protein